MNEQQPPGTETTGLPEGAGSGDEISLPLGVGDTAAETGFEGLGQTGPPRRVRSGTMLLVIVVGCAVALLFSMRLVARVSAAVADNSEVEKTVEEFLMRFTGDGAIDQDDAQSRFSADEAVFSALENDYTRRQVPLSAVQRNPFIIFLPARAGAAGPSRSDASDHDALRELERERRREDRRQEMRLAAARLDLKSVLMGRQPIAHLSGQLVRVGDVITLDVETPPFTVTAIEPDSLTVATEDPELDVSVTVTLYLDGTR